MRGSLLLIVALIVVHQLALCSKERCNAPTHLPGIRCKARIPRYTYNKEENICELFFYGGCRPSPNNFRTIEECTETCVQP